MGTYRVKRTGVVWAMSVLLACIMLLALFPSAALAQPEADEPFAEGDVIIDAITGEPAIRNEQIATSGIAGRMQIQSILPLNDTPIVTRAQAISIFARMELIDYLVGPNSGNFRDITDEFTDVQIEHWFYPQVSLAFEHGWITSAEAFRPNDTITRQEFVVFAVRARGLEPGGTHPGFRDVPASSWAAGYINRAASEGWIYGGENNIYFFPQDALTHEHARLIVGRMVGGVAPSISNLLGTIIWNVNGGTPSPPFWQRAVDIAIGNQTPTPTREGYQFDGWWTGGVNNTRLTPSTPMPHTGQFTYHARWVRNTQEVIFDANGGTWPAGTVGSPRRTINRSLTTDRYSQAFNASDQLVAPTMNPPTRAGWVFTGWFDAATGGRRVLGTDTVTSATSRRIFAQWTRTMQEVTFNANGGVFSQGETTLSGRINRGLAADTYAQAFAANGNLVTPTRSRPTQAGWTFVGWFDSATGGNQVLPTMQVTSAASRTLFAQWVRNTQEVTFDANGGVWPAGTVGAPRRTITRDLAADVYTQAFDASDNLANPALNRPTRTGWIFAGWFDATTGGTRISNTDAVSATDGRTLYAQWVPVRGVRFNQNRDGTYLFIRFNLPLNAWGQDNPVAPFFDVRRGSGADSRFDQVIGTGGVVPTRAGHVLSTLRDGRLEASGGSARPITENRYWMVSQTQPNAVFGGWFDTVVHADDHGSTTGRISPNMQVPDGTTRLEVHARWYPTRTVRFAAGPDAVWPEDAGTATTSAAEGAVILRRLSTTETAIAGSFLGRITEEQTGTLAQVLHEDGRRVMAGVCVSNVGRPDVVPTRPGYVFGGWQTEPDGGGATVWYNTALASLNGTDASAVFPIARDMAATEPITLYALWLPDTLEVTFDPNGGTWGSQIENPVRRINHGQETDRFTQAFDENGNLVNPARNHPTRSGRAFAGWFTMPTGGDRVVSEDRVLSAGTRTLFAQWYTTITWDANGGGVGEDTWHRRADTGLGGLQVPSRAGYTFIGWFTEPTGGSQVLSSTRVPNVDSVTYWARWRSGNAVELIFHGNGGAPSETTLTQQTGSDIALPPQPERHGYDFSGWFTTSAATGGQQVTAQTPVPSNSTTYWARWVSRNAVTITFNHNDGNPPNTSTLVRAPGSVFGTLSTPRRHGHIFVGWFTHQTGGTQITANSVVPGANTTYWARWERNHVLAVGVRDASGTIGDRVDVEVWLDSNPDPGINALRIYLEYDPSVLVPAQGAGRSVFGQTVVDVRPGSFMPMPVLPVDDEAMPSPRDNDRNVIPLIFEMVSMQNVTGSDQRLATVSFHVLGTATPGSVTEVRPINGVASRATQGLSAGEPVTINMDIDADLTIGEVRIAVDRTALQRVLDAANQRTEEGYTPESWAVFVAARSAAQTVNENPAATQSEIDAAAAALERAMAELVEVVAEYGWLEISLAGRVSGCVEIYTVLSHELVFSGCTDCCGLLTLALPVGEYEINVMYPGRSGYSATVRAGQTTEVWLELQLWRPVPFEGRVRDATTGVPISDATVRLITFSPGNVINQMQTCCCGWFWIGAGYASSFYLLEAYADGFYMGGYWVSGPYLSHSGGFWDIDLPLWPEGFWDNTRVLQRTSVDADTVESGAVRGHIRSETGIPITYAEVVLLDTATGEPIAQTTTDIFGFYEFTGLEPGTYAVEISAEDFLDGTFDFVEITEDAGMDLNVLLQACPLQNRTIGVPWNGIPTRTQPIPAPQGGNRS